MNELGSLIPSSKREKTKEPDFGTYHHSTCGFQGGTYSSESYVHRCLHFYSVRRDDELKILDVGCGLGFLSCVSAEFYQTAWITGIDTFEHASFKRSSLGKAKENSERFQEG